MFAQVHRPKDTPGRNNKGSCTRLIDYLDKENEELKEADRHSFFSHKSNIVSASEVMQTIDNNIKKLKKSDDKFYMLSLNPSQLECKTIIEKCTGRNDVSEFSQLSKEDQEKVFEELRIYTRRAMDLYAQNFHRDKIRSGEDLVYFAMIETKREYKYTDELVQQGVAHTGDEKPGLNLHVHVVVSRNDLTQTVSLSPLAQSRGNSWELNGQQVTRGFNHEDWKSNCGLLFREMYQNHRSQRQEVYKRSYAQTQAIKNKLTAKLKNEILQGQFRDERNMINKAERVTTLVSSPKSFLVSSLKAKVKDLISTNDAVI